MVTSQDRASRLEGHSREIKTRKPEVLMSLVLLRAYVGQQNITKTFSGIYMENEAKRYSSKVSATI